MIDPIIVTVRLNANPEKVWKAITNRELMKQWYFDIPDFELRENSAFNFYEPGEEKKFHHRCVIKEILPNHKLRHTWTYPNQSKGESELIWEILPEGEHSSLKLIHSGIENFADGGQMFARENFVAGWNEIIGKSLPGFLENNIENL